MSADTISREALLIAIRAKCMDCSGHSRVEVERCLLKNCPLYPYRTKEAVGGQITGHTHSGNHQVGIFELHSEQKAQYLSGG